MSAHLKELFEKCDPEGTGSVDREALRGLCSKFSISARDADVIFDDLDHDQDGKVSFSDFSRGFSDFLVTMGDQQETEEENIKLYVWTALTSEAEHVAKTTSLERLQWLLGELQTTEQRHLVPHLETAVEELLANLRHVQEEKRQLEQAWWKEKVEHERHLHQMEEELDFQVKDAEQRVRMKAQAEAEGERRSLQSKMDADMDALQAHLALFEKVNAWLQTHPSDIPDVRVDEVCAKLEDAVQENRQLRMSLLDTQTSIALMRSEVLQLRTLYEEKCRELSTEREKILDVLYEQDHLSRQLHLLHDVNKRLQDANDALRVSTDGTSPNQIPGRPLISAKTGSVLGDYLESGISREVFCRLPGDEENRAILKRAQSIDVNFPLKISSDLSARRLENQSDSGVSTVLDVPEGNKEGSDTTAGSPRYCFPPQRGSLISTHKAMESENQMDEGCFSHPHFKHSTESDTDTNTNGKIPRKENNEIDEKSKHEEEELPRKRIADIKRQLGIDDTRVSWKAKTKTTEPVADASMTFSRPRTPPVPLPRTTKSARAVEDPHCKPTEEETSDDQREEQYEPDGAAEHTYKVVFVGDAGVGKSSFALRLSKGVFVQHMSSTLGVDFLMRTLHVDGKNVAVQLWDTAGQERFRSITKSYFRKADGVLLLYDCTCERSFLNVRQWVEDVDVSCFYRLMACQSTSTNWGVASKRIPLMIVGNKIDLRQMAYTTGQSCVSTAEGEKLAKDCDAIFMEASAKDGTNVIQALAKLIRSMAIHRDVETTASTMHLCEVKTKRPASCCGR